MTRRPKRPREYPSIAKQIERVRIATIGKRGHQAALVRARLESLREEIKQREAAR